MGDTVALYDQNIIAAWNSVVQCTDVVFFLGDFGFGNKQYLCEILESLNGFIYFVQGNHDSNKFVRSYGRFERVVVLDRRQVVTIDDAEILLSHKPQDNQSMFNIHGHEHYRFPDNIPNRRFNVSVDACIAYNDGVCFTPISWDRIKLKNKV
jgi:calcineurin-like phosphoesterase family protein